MVIYIYRLYQKYGIHQLMPVKSVLFYYSFSVPDPIFLSGESPWHLSFEPWLLLQKYVENGMLPKGSPSNDMDEIEENPKPGSVMFENKLHVVCIQFYGIPSIHVLDVCSGLCLICSFDTSSSKCVDSVYQHLHFRHYPQTCTNLQALGGAVPVISGYRMIYRLTIINIINIYIYIRIK